MQPINPGAAADCLFEAVSIGPFKTKNRFYAAPHGTANGSAVPNSTIEIKREKAVGGWSVVCTEQAEIHPTSDMSPSMELKFWDAQDHALARALSDAVHEHGALAAIELSHSGANASNASSWEPAIAPSGGLIVPSIPIAPPPIHARAMDLADVRQFRAWHRDAAIRAAGLGFDIVYVYAGRLFSLPSQFISPAFNRRSDRYGGPIENRARLLRELTEDTLEALGGKAAVAVRLTVDELLDPARGHPDLHATFDIMGELPDLWDVVVNGMGEDAGSARFDSSSMCIELVSLIKTLTTKPVASVGFLSDASAMRDLVMNGVLDLFAAARPAIADPHLPNKIREGREQDVTHCIRCNLCVAGDLTPASVKCTQNPVFGEQFRRGWRISVLPMRGDARRIAVVGSGPAGLECAATLGERGYHATVLEGSDAPGGRALTESRLPGLALWRKVFEDRLRRIDRLPNVEVRTGEYVDGDDLLEAGFDHVVIATGAVWLRDGTGRCDNPYVDVDQRASVHTPDDIMSGVRPLGQVVVYDEDFFYMASVLAEVLVEAGSQVTFVTPAPEVAPFSHLTMEQRFIQARLLKLGVKIEPSQQLTAASTGHIATRCIYTGRSRQIGCDAIVLVAGRAPVDRLYRKLLPSDAVTRIGDAFAPGLIGHAIFSGHRFGREFETGDQGRPYRRDLPAIA